MHLYFNSPLICCSFACWGISAVSSWEDPLPHWWIAKWPQHSDRRSDTNPRLLQSYQPATPGLLNRQCLQKLIEVISLGHQEKLPWLLKTNSNVMKIILIAFIWESFFLPHDTGIWKVELSFGVWLKKSAGEMDPEVLASAAASSDLWKAKSFNFSNRY